MVIQNDIDEMVMIQEIQKSYIQNMKFLNKQQKKPISKRINQWICQFR
ncbi:unnamed protein product [Paramecium sonneborni]|uniref:Uncharacterized protein n=1 Tax=Paramecium sonneborni TaxID=65129 RepID=A0A8S1KFU3_9CILI|nr:unnamed protein product [Paramecium sonneborni]